MLQWTEAGAVSWPQTLQVRISKRYEHRIKAGAPEPSRRLSYQEFEENLYYFRHTLNTPRTRHCTSITLSGLQEENPESMKMIHTALKRVGFDYIRVHIDTKSKELLQYVEFAHHISITLSRPDEWLFDSIPTKLHSKIQVTIALNNNTLSNLNSIISSTKAIYPFPITLIYPFPLNTKIIRSAPPILEVQQKLTSISPDIPIVGIPQCLSQREYSKKTSNRWYVDANHQKEKALLFFPDLLRYYKSEGCRFCSANSDCDGFFSQYLDKNLLLSPLS